nr:putative nucleotidyltransferase, ribonuclease H [Tanacetum cinerariifolium]
ASIKVEEEIIRDLERLDIELYVRGHHVEWHEARCSNVCIEVFDLSAGLQKAWGTRLKFSTAFHPRTDCQSERTIQTLEDMLRSCALEWTGNWDDYICLVGERVIEGPEMIEVTNEKVAVAKKKLKEA